MKTGTKVLLIIAGILIVSGLIVCVTGSIIANSTDVELLCNEVVDGDAITTEDLSEYSLTDCNLDIDGIPVKITGNCEKTYVEFINVNRANYNFTVKNHKLVIKTINPFSINDIWETYVYNIRENKGGFDGLRHYVFLPKYNDKKPQINIYLSADTAITSVFANVKNAGLFVNSVFNTGIDYNLNTKNGNLTVSSIYSKGTLRASCDNGNLKLIKANVAKTLFGTQNANVEISYNTQFNYAITCANGVITVDDKEHEPIIQELYPETTDTKDADKSAPNTIEGNVTGADVVIKKISE